MEAVQEIQYTQNGIQFSSTLVQAKGDEPLPAILLVPNLWGPNDYWTRQAIRLSQWGYHVLVVDMYSEAVRPQSHEEAYAVITSFRSDRVMVRERMQAALAVLSSQPNVDAGRVGAVGYCFGGMCVLELARMGAKICGIVSLHGKLMAHESGPVKELAAKVLILHGAEDPMIPDTEVSGFISEMRKAGADWQLVHFGGAVHAFTDSHANRPGEAIYDEKADRRSFLMMQHFLEEIFQ